MRKGAKWPAWSWMYRTLAVVFIGIGMSMPCEAEDQARRVLAKTAPSYPELARKIHLAGKVKLELLISPNGSVTTAKLVGGSPVFEKDAIEAVKQWRFERAPKETQQTVVLEFSDH